MHGGSPSERIPRSGGGRRLPSTGARDLRRSAAHPVGTHTSRRPGRPPHSFLPPGVLKTSALLLEGNEKPLIGIPTAAILISRPRKCAHAGLRVKLANNSGTIYFHRVESAPASGPFLYRVERARKTLSPDDKLPRGGMKMRQDVRAKGAGTNKQTMENLVKATTRNKYVAMRPQCRNFLTPKSA